MTLLPPHGICLPIYSCRIEDARTVLVDIRGRDGLRDRFLVEFATCEPVAGRQVAAIDAAEDALSGAHHLSLWLPLPPSTARLLRAIDHRPLVGEIFLDSDRTLSQHLRRLGLAVAPNASPSFPRKYCP